MMRTIKKKIRPWKMAAFFALVPVIFVAIACQDQVANDIDSIAKNSAATTNAPEHVQKRLDQLKAENPEVNYVLIQMNEKAAGTLKKLEAKYGLPKSMEVFTGDNEPIKGASASGVVVEVPKNDNTTFAILAYDELKQHDSFVTADGDVFTVVEKMPEYVGGQAALGEYLGENIKYPKTALDAGITGVVFTQFIVNPDGKISDVSILRGVNDDLNNEALRVVESMPAWNPGEQQGKRVKVKFVLPIKFAN
jgi:TonB family protein